MNKDVTPITRFIIADDDDIVIKLLYESLFLNNDHFELLAIASDGRQLIEHCQNFEADIVITDIDMPVVNGIAAIKNVRELQIPVKFIALSNYSNHAYYKHLLDAGANAYVLKDLQYTFFELKKAIEQVKKDCFYLDSKVKVNRESQPVTDTVIDPVNELNSSERKVARLIYAGRTVNQISREIGKSPKTIEKYRTDVYEKLGVKNAIELVKFIALHDLTF